MQNPSQQLAATPLTKPSALAVMGSRFNVDPAKLHSTLKNTVFKGASDEEMLALVVVANEYGLNPLTKEIYAFPAKGGGIVPVVSVDGWNNLANSHPQMDGMDFEFGHDQDGKLVSCTCIIYRKDRSRPVKVTEYLNECRRNTEPWKMEHRMLRHKALIQCARMAFGFSGVYDEDDAKHIVNVVDVEPVQAARVPAKTQAPAPTRQTNDEPLVLDASPPPTMSEQVLAACARDGITWDQVAQSAVNNGAMPNVCAVEDADVADLRNLLAHWSAVVADVKGGNA